MAQLTAEQKQAVSEWAEAGATLNDVQSKLKSEFGLSMTYMEARLLMMEMEVRLKDKHQAAQAAVPAPETAAPAASEDAEDTVVDAFYDDEEAAVANEAMEAPAESGSFAMEADEIMVPGTLVSGRATFSDGMQAKWFLDQMGRLSLKADQAGYQPPAADVPKFQQGLEKILIKLGLY